MLELCSASSPTAQTISTIEDTPLFLRVRPQCWTRWASWLEDVRYGGALASEEDIEALPLPPRHDFVPDPRIAELIDSRHDSRHGDYYRTIASWARYGTRPVDPERAKALYAWSAAVFFLDDLVDGWDGAMEELELDELIEAQRRLMAALEGEVTQPHAARPSQLPHLEETARVVARASRLCFELRPSEAWWNDYLREMTIFVHGRLVTLFMARHRVWLGPERYLRARAFDIGGNTASIMAAFSRGVSTRWSPEVTREIATLQALSWQHMTVVNDLYSYHRERDETLFNAIHTVHASASRKRPTTLRQAIDCVVRFANRSWGEFRLRSHRLLDSVAGREAPDLSAYLDELAINMMGNVDFVREEPTRYRGATELDGSDRALSDVAELYGHQQWTRPSWGGLDPLLQEDPLGRSCSEFVLAESLAA